LILLGFLSLSLVTLPRTAAGQITGQDAINSLVQRFFLAYEKKDLLATMALWDEVAPDACIARLTFKKRFSKDPDVQIKVNRVDASEVVGDSIKVTAVVEWRRAGDKAQTPSSDVKRIFYLVKRGGAWKVSLYLSSEEDLARRIGSSQTESRRKELLAANTPLINLDFDAALEQEGRRLITHSRYLQALSVYNVKLEVATELDNRSGMAAALVGIGNSYQSTAFYDKGREYLDKGLKMYTDFSDPSGIARALVGIGHVLTGQGRLAEARGYIVKSIKLTEEAHDKEEGERAVFFLARLEDEEGNYPEALVQFRRALGLAEELGDAYLIGWCWNNIAIVLGKRGDYQGALENLEKGLKAAEEMGNQELSAATFNNMGILQRNLGNYEQALADEKRSLEIHQEIGDKLGIAYALDDVGNDYADLHDFPRALDFLKKCLSLLQEIRAGGRI
ncbi:MAG: tetratricopeptide repeat protein, partial [Blastocatellia bacterium]